MQGGSAPCTPARGVSLARRPVARPPAWCMPSQGGSAPCTPAEVGAAPSGPPPDPRAVLCRRLAACSTQVRAEPSAAAGSDSLVGVVWKHRLCCRYISHFAFCILHAAFAKARRNVQGATSGRGPRPALWHKPVPAPGRPRAAGTGRASSLGSRGDSPGAGGPGGPAAALLGRGAGRQRPQNQGARGQPRGVATAVSQRQAGRTFGKRGRA
jgi:hypothetical protein